MSKGNFFPQLYNKAELLDTSNFYIYLSVPFKYPMYPSSHTAGETPPAEVCHGLHGSRLLLYPGNPAMALLLSHGLCRVRPSLHFSAFLVAICCLDGKPGVLP